MSGNFHESLDRPDMPLPPDRSTGLVFVGVALVVALIWRGNGMVAIPALGASAVLLAISLLRPILLRPLNIVWMRFAAILGKIVNPIVMLILFAIAIVPAGLIMQALRDPLRKKRPTGDSFWTPVDAAERARVSNMKNQF